MHCTQDQNGRGRSSGLAAVSCWSRAIALAGWPAATEMPASSDSAGPYRGLSFSAGLDLLLGLGPFPLAGVAHSQANQNRGVTRRQVTPAEEVLPGAREVALPEKNVAEQQPRARGTKGTCG